MSTMRSLRRGIVHSRMRNAGVRRINKKHWFAHNWRDPMWNKGLVKKGGE